MLTCEQDMGGNGDAVDMLIHVATLQRHVVQIAGHGIFWSPWNAGKDCWVIPGPRIQFKKRFSKMLQLVSSACKLSADQHCC